MDGKNNFSYNYKGIVKELINKITVIIFTWVS